mmetsp:Transcript_15555/g.45004  ORF Transcript_15555/g.45004 Transcript_15555/m.45004 type:complete len:281 (-) Transcript_15555:363-1205(-)
MPFPASLPSSRPPRRVSARRPAGPSPTLPPATRTRSRPSSTTTSSRPLSSSSPTPSSISARRPPGPSATPPPAAMPPRSSSWSSRAASAPCATSSPSTTPRSLPSPSRVWRTSSRSATRRPSRPARTTRWQPSSPRPRASLRSRSCSSTPTTTSTRSASRFSRRTLASRTRRRCPPLPPRWPRAEISLRSVPAMPRWKVDSTSPAVLLLRRQGVWRRQGSIGCTFRSCVLVKYMHGLFEDSSFRLLKGHGLDCSHLAQYFVESRLYFICLGTVVISFFIL